MYVKGVSTRKVQAIFDRLCDVNITADQVSRATREMDKELENWRNRPIGCVKALFAATVEKYATCQSKLAAWMEENIPEGFTVFSFPEDVRQFLRTNNLEENLNKQIKSRTRLIPAFPNTDSLLRLVSAICVEISDDWEAGNYKYMCAIKEL